MAFGEILLAPERPKSLAGPPRYSDEVPENETSRSAISSARNAGSASTFPLVLLWVVAALFLGFGVGFAVAPKFFADFFIPGAAPTVPSAVIDMRATYGGVAFGIGLFFGVAATRPQWLRPALVASLLVDSSIGAARAVGIVADGNPNAWMLFFLATEVIFAGVIVLALRQVDPRTGEYGTER